MRRGVTLLELMIVVIVVGILASIALPLFSKARENSLDKEAWAFLKVMQAGGKAYDMEVGYLYPVAGTIASVIQINDDLMLALPTTSGWGLNMTRVSGPDVRIKATRTDGSRTWSLGMHEDEPCLSGSGTCP